MEQGRAPTVGLRTIGCKLNRYETEGLMELLEAAGYAVVPFTDVADVYVVNTCTVTARSDYRCRQMLRRAARTNPDALIVATGCYAQRDPDALAEMPEVGLVVSQSMKGDVAALVERARSERASADSTSNAHAIVCARPHETASFASFDIDRFRGYTRAFLKIQDGCDRRCAYCAVPGARGPARSRPIDDVIEQAARLSGNGYRELVLTGVHIGAYGEGTDGPRLPEVIAALLDVESLSRIRLGSIEPTELTCSLVETILSSRRVARHVHVPLQSGSDRILSAMRRGYTRDEYKQAVRRIADRDPELGLGADVIVGFPGETDEDFADTVSLLKELPITYLHVFSFSPRPGTEAAAMRDDVPGTEKKCRSRLLRRLGREKSGAFRAGLVGSRQEVLLEEGSDRGGGTVSGLAGNYVRVEVEGGRALCNRLLLVRIDGADDSRTWGTVIRKPEAR